MPLSRARDKARKKQSRLDAKNNAATVQPKVEIYNPNKRYNVGDKVWIRSPGGYLVESVIPTMDADGNPVYIDN